MVLTGNEILFYCGLAVSGIALIVIVVYLFLVKNQRSRLNAQLDAEYGPEKERRHGR